MLQTTSFFFVTQIQHQAVGLVKDGRWLTDEELEAGVNEWANGWTEVLLPEQWRFPQQLIEFCFNVPH